jgi:hypothetical protein
VRRHPTRLGGFSGCVMVAEMRRSDWTVNTAVADISGCSGECRRREISFDIWSTPAKTCTSPYTLKSYIPHEPTYQHDSSRAKLWPPNCRSFPAAGWICGLRPPSH